MQGLCQAMAIDHDQIFKNLIEAFFREFMQLFFASIAEQIDFSSVEFLRKEYFTDVQLGKRRAMDLVVKVQLLNGQERFILIHVEFESKRPGRMFARRMFKYMCQLFLRYDIEILPVVVFSDESVWQKPIANIFKLEVAGRSIVRFEYQSVKLKALNYRDYLGSENPLAFALMAKMNYNRREQVRLKADFLRLILGSRIDEARRSLLVEFVETYVPLMGNDFIEFQELIHTENQYEEVEKMVTVYEQIGMEKGMEKGIEKGMEREKQNTLVKLLAKKFGSVPEEMDRAIRAIDSFARLDELLLSVLDAKSLNGFLG